MYYWHNTYDVSKDDFEFFCKKVDDFIELFDLQGMRVKYRHVDLRSTQELSNVTFVTSTPLGLCVTLSTVWPFLPGDAELTRAAYKSACSLLLSPIQILVRKNGKNEATAVLDSLCNDIILKLSMACQKQEILHLQNKLLL